MYPHAHPDAALALALPLAVQPGDAVHALLIGAGPGQVHPDARVQGGPAHLVLHKIAVGEGHRAPAQHLHYPVEAAPIDDVRRQPLFDGPDFAQPVHQVEVGAHPPHQGHGPVAVGIIEAGHQDAASAVYPPGLLRLGAGRPAAGVEDLLPLHQHRAVGEAMLPGIQLHVVHQDHRPCASSPK